MSSAPLSPAAEDYLKALLSMGACDATVSITAVAEGLGVKGPTATEMTRRLDEGGWVRYLRGKGLELTAAGTREAGRIVRRHRLLELFLTDVLGLSWHEVHEEAEILEHYISDRLERALVNRLGEPTEDPHGQLIPDSEGRLSDVRELVPFEQVGYGQRVVIRECSDKDSGRLAHWKTHGFSPGTVVEVVSVNRLDDIFELSVSGRLVRVGSEGLRDIKVELMEAGGQRESEHP